MNSHTIDGLKFTEGLFRIEVAKNNTKIDADRLIISVITNPTVISYYKEIYGGIEPSVPTEAAMNLLEKLVGLHIRVRSHWYACGIEEKHQSKKVIIEEKIFMKRMKDDVK